jgi:TonB-linked SusC/RagA family outer membrane protein
MVTRITKFVFFLFTFSFGFIFSQEINVKGTVKDEKGEPVPYARVVVETYNMASVTDFEGNYLIKGLPQSAAGTKVNITVSCISYAPFKEEITLAVGDNQKDITINSDALMLDDLVVIGYGSARTKDLTGAATKVGEKDFNKTVASTPEQLIQGKVAGVKITSNDGAPGSGSTIRLRGGTSINASNDPLIVVDGVPLDNGGIAGVANPLAMINPNDIETFVILKDASATAIYGSRAANGVILITTKKGDGATSKLSIALDAKNSVSTIAKFADVMTADEFRTVVNSKGTTNQKSRLGTANTDWQREIYRSAYINENNLSVSGGIKKLPYRFSFSNRFEQGLLKTDQFNRYTVGLNLNPSFFKNTLKLEINNKFTTTNSFFANRNAIGSANTFDPTQPVYSGNSNYGGYFEWLQTNGKPNTLAPKNPLGLLMQQRDLSNVARYIGNAQVTYKLPFFPEVKAVVNVGTDYSKGQGEVYQNANSAAGYFTGGRYAQYESTKLNKLFDSYLNYSNAEKKKPLRYDFTLGYSYQSWESEAPTFNTFNYDKDSSWLDAAPFPFYTRNVLVSYYSRGIVSYKDRYVLTASIRTDGSSRFSKENRWGWFPALSGAWIVSEENFLKENKVVTHLKLRGGYGVNGQQDIFSDYPYIPNYQIGTGDAMYQFGNMFYTLYRPDAYDANIRWEQTNSYNFGIDFGFLKDRINGSIDWYRKTTKDLIATVPIPAGTNFANQLLTNVGSMLNTGIEFSINAGVIAKKDMKLDIGFNATRNINEVLKLSQVENDNSPGVLVGGIAGGIGNNVQIHSLGYPTFSYYVYQQKYDGNGKPIEVGAINPSTGLAYKEIDAYADLNGDGIINSSDRYRFKKAAADWFLGLNFNFTYKKWFAGTSMRSEIGGYIYNNVHSNSGTYQAVGGTMSFLNNLSALYLNEEFQKTTEKQLLSDHYIELANFLRMDYFSFGYDFGKLKYLKNMVALKAAFTVNNVFVITKYSGLDPEVVGGIDNNIYPRPRVYSLNLSFNF